MKMTYETKANHTGGSTIIVIPSALVKLLKIEKGDTITWDVDISDSGAVVTVTPKKE